MLRYHNALLGRTIERHEPDEWLDASGTWERLDEPAPDDDGPEAFSGTLEDGLDDNNESEDD